MGIGKEGGSQGEEKDREEKGLGKERRAVKEGNRRRRGGKEAMGGGGGMEGIASFSMYAWASQCG